MGGSETPADAVPDDRGEGHDAPRPRVDERKGDGRRGRGSLRLLAGAATDQGRVRSSNEDAYVLESPMFAVADGMGGENAGEVASGLAVEALVQQGRRARGSSSLVEWVRGANSAVFQRSQQEEAVAGMGTTLTAVVADHDRLRLAHVGDSRAYLLRGGELTKLTTDHTKVQELVELGVITPEEARTHPQRNVITRALGLGDELQVDEAVVPLEPGDRVLLCSDGLSGMLNDVSILSVLGDAATPQEAADTLVAAANEAGGADNITAVVLDAEAASAGGSAARPRRRAVWALVGLLALLAIGLAAMVIAGIGPFADDAAAPTPSPAPSATPPGPSLAAYLDQIRSALPPGADAQRPFPGLVLEGLRGPVTCDELRSASGVTASELAQIPPVEGAPAEATETIERAVSELEELFATLMPVLADRIETASRASDDRHEQLERAGDDLATVDDRYAAVYGRLVETISQVDPALPSPVDAVGPAVCLSSS